MKHPPYIRFMHWWYKLINGVRLFFSNWANFFIFSKFQTFLNILVEKLYKQCSWKHMNFQLMLCRSEICIANIAISCRTFLLQKVQRFLKKRKDEICRSILNQFSIFPSKPEEKNKKRIIFNHKQVRESDFLNNEVPNVHKKNRINVLSSKENLTFSTVYEICNRHTIINCTPTLCPLQFMSSPPGLEGNKHSK